MVFSFFSFCNAGLLAVILFNCQNPTGCPSGCGGSSPRPEEAPAAKPPRAPAPTIASEAPFLRGAGKSARQRRSPRPCGVPGRRSLCVGLGPALQGNSSRRGAALSRWLGNALPRCTVSALAQACRRGVLPTAPRTAAAVAFAERGRGCGDPVRSETRRGLAGVVLLFRTHQQIQGGERLLENEVLKE